MTKKITYLFILILIGKNITAQPKMVPPIQKTRILFIFDASQSMWGEWQTGKKIDVAKKLMSSMLDSLDKISNLELALRVYGHQSPVRSKIDRDCKDTKLEVSFAPYNAGKIKKRILELQPKGTTPIAYTLEQTAGDFPTCKDCRNIIILVTDGIEECDGDPCLVSQALQKNNIVLKPFIIGMGLGTEVRQAFECVGNYFDANTEEAFNNILGVVISQALNNTTAQVNLLDIYGKPTESNVNMTFYDQHTGAIRYNYMHTINHRGNPDTIQIDPLGKYRMVVHTTPQVIKDSISLTPGKHNIIAADAPQGILQLKMSGMNEYKNLKTIVRKKGELTTLNIQDFNITHKYLVGKYDLEILTLPRTYVNNVDIAQSHTTTVEVPQPGMVVVNMPSPGHASLYVEEKNELKWIYNLDENQTMHNIVLQPGRYRIIYRPKGAKETIYTVERQFKIESGLSVSLKL